MRTSSSNKEIGSQYTPPTSTPPLYDVVIVDDDELVLEIVKRKLRQSTLLFACIQSPQEALNFLLTNQTRLLIVDYRMPQMNGLELIERSKDYPLMSVTDVFIASSVDLPPHTEAMALKMGTQSLLKDRFSEPGFLEHLISSQSAS